MDNNNMKQDKQHTGQDPRLAIVTPKPYKNPNVTVNYKAQRDGWWTVHCTDAKGGNGGRWCKSLTQCIEFANEFMSELSSDQRSRETASFKAWVLDSTKSYEGYRDGLD
jgi:hypothetical protein